MKKFFSLVAIAAVAATMFTSCSDDDKPSTDQPKKAALSLSVDKPTLDKAGDKGTFTVTSDIAAPADINITVKSSAVAFVTVEPAVTIKAGTKTATGSYVAVADGKATISIEATGVTLSVPSKEVTVGEKAPDLPVIFEVNEAYPWPDNQWVAQEEGGAYGFTLWFNAGTVLLENLGANYYGADLELKAVDKGTDISTLQLTMNEAHTTMGSNSEEGFDQLPTFVKIGAAQYIVFSITLEETTDHTVPQVTGWALVTSKSNGTSVILHEAKFPATKVGE